MVTSSDDDPGRTLLAQISDAHLAVGPGDGPSARALEAAVRSIAALDPAPQAVLISGDLVDTGTAHEYQRARELLSPLAMPVHVLAGNHDDRDALRTYFGPPKGNGADEFLQYVVTVGRLRLVICDTMLPGRNEGCFDAQRAKWLEAALAAEAAAPTIIAMHHPPLITGVRVLDVNGLPAADRGFLEQLVAANPQVKRIVAGHFHRTIVGTLGGCGVFVCPSSHLQIDLGSAFSDRVVLVQQPPGFALHVTFGDEVASHADSIALA